MKGKRLYHLLNDLNKSQLQQLHYRCTLGEDKRRVVLKALLESDYKTKDEYSKAIAELFVYFQDLPDGEKTLRRFIDFACKEIENLQIQNYLNEHGSARDFLLVQVYNFDSSAYLFHYYHDKAVQSNQKEGNYWREILELYHQKIQWHFRGQSRKDYQQIKHYILEKHRLNEEGYYSELCMHYNTLSGMYLEDNHDLDEFSGLIPSEESFELLIRNSPKPSYASQLYLAQARFSFRDAQELEIYISKAEVCCKQIADDAINFERVNRSILYLRILAGMNYFAPMNELLEQSQVVFEVNQKYAYKDSVSFFLHQMLLMLAGDWEQMRRKRRKYADFYFDESNVFYPQFLEGLECFLLEEDEKALLLLNILSYASSHYVALWSKLIVLKIHAELGNWRLAKKLIDRANYYLKNNVGKIFTRVAAEQLVTVYTALVQKESLPKTAQKFYFFELLMPQTL